MKRLLHFVALVLLASSCTKDVTKRKEVYFNTFEGNNVRGFNIDNPQGAMDPKQLFVYEGNTLLGPFNTNYVQLHLNGLPEHNRLKIEFDLYIHDNWTGNLVQPGNNKPDLWVLEVDQQYPLVTTFGNKEGLYQSFPLQYIPGVNQFPARGNSWEIKLPSRCAQLNSEAGTTLYKVDLFHFHNNGTARIAFTDQMQGPLSICDKSWSIDNVRITALMFY